MKHWFRFAKLSELFRWPARLLKACLDQPFTESSRVDLGLGRPYDGLPLPVDSPKCTKADFLVSKSRRTNTPVFWLSIEPQLLMLESRASIEKKSPSKAAIASLCLAPTVQTAFDTIFFYLLLIPRFHRIFLQILRPV